MNILLIHQYYLEKNDGGGSRWNEMTKMWAEGGHTITVLAGMTHYSTGTKNPRYKGKYFFKDDNFEPGIKVVRSHVSEAYNVNFLGRLWGYFSFVFSSIWAGLFKAKGKFDVIVVTSPPLFVGITAYVLSRFKGVPFVFEIRDLWPESAIDTGVVTNKWIIKMAYWFEAFIYRKAKLINVLTPAFRDTLIEKKKVPAEKIIFIPNAADFSLSEQLLQNFDAAAFRKEHGFDGQMVLTYVGAHGVANHLIQVVEAAEHFRDKPVIFQLIGDGMQKKMLQEEVAKRNLPNVRFVGSVSKKDVFKYILASDMGMSVLKKVDTFKTVYSNKTFDYMSCKKPILMAIDGVSRELVEKAGAGAYIEPENVEEYVKVINWYLNNPQSIVEQGLSGYNYAKKYFDREVLAEKYIDTIKALLSREPNKL
jgi:glycosyltransferase involved in cell wall biosynthesis